MVMVPNNEEDATLEETKWETPSGFTKIFLTTISDMTIPLAMLTWREGLSIVLLTTSLAIMTLATTTICIIPLSTRIKG